MRISQRLADATTRFLDTLGEQDRAAVAHAFTETRLRHRWDYTPGPRAGLSFGELDRAQRQAVHQLIRTALSPHAYGQAATIMALEDVLDHYEQGRRGRHNTDYWIAVFGTPGADEPWGCRFEGHHLSINLTVNEGVVSATPCFFGANPAAVYYGDTAVVRPLSLEEERARALLDLMGAANRRLAVVNDSAPADIRTRMAAHVDPTVEPLGVPLGALSGASAQVLRDLVVLYLDRFHPDLAAEEPVDLSGGDIHFAWEGSLTPGTDHYYRIHAPNLLIEYDNTGNHAHSVLRRPATDFGRDLLAEHHLRHHSTHAGT